MAVSCFADKTVEPSDTNLKEVLGENAALLNEIEAYLHEVCGAFSLEWKFYGKQAGWTLAYTHKKRRLFHLIPKQGVFEVVFVLGERAVEASLGSMLPDRIKSSIEAAPAYAEGRSIRVEIQSSKDVSTTKQLLSIKLAN